MEVLYKDSFCKISISYDTENKFNLAHIEITKWSLSMYKHYLFVVGECLNLVKTRGIKEIFSVVRDEKKQKFNSLFGFSIYNQVKEKETNNVYTLMRLEC